MHAVLKVDLEPRVRSVIIAQNFVNASRAVALSRLSIFWQVHANRHAIVIQLKMAGLRFFVVGGGKAYVRQAIKAENAIRFRILNLWIVSRLARAFSIGFAMRQRAEK